MSNVVGSESQQAQRERFRPAPAYATRAKADPKVWANYERRAKRLNNRFRDLAILDYFQEKNYWPRSETIRVSISGALLGVGLWPCRDRTARFGSVRSRVQICRPN